MIRVNTSHSLNRVGRDAYDYMRSDIGVSFENNVTRLLWSDGEELISLTGELTPDDVDTIFRVISDIFHEGVRAGMYLANEKIKQVLNL